MTKSSDYMPVDAGDGVTEYNLSTWEDFHAFVYREMLNYEHYIWRGQRRSDPSSG